MSGRCETGELGAKTNPQGRGEFMVSYAVFRRIVKLNGVDFLDPQWRLLWVCQNRDEAINDCRCRIRDNDNDVIEVRYEETEFYPEYSAML